MEDQVVFEHLSKLFGNYWQEAKNSQHPVIDYQDADALSSTVDLSLNADGEAMETILQHADHYLQHTARTTSPKFLNQLFSTISLPALIGEMLAAISNTSMYTYEVAPLATLIERELIQTMRNKAGFPDGEGIFVTGGSNANLIAVLCARHKMAPNIKQTGSTDANNLVMFVSDQAHYSFQTAAHVTGIGIQNVIAIASNDDGRMNMNALQNAIEQTKQNGQQPFFVAATAGTTVKGAFDPIQEICHLAKENNMWVHVDGSFGGSVLLSNEHKHRLTGLSNADSMTWTAHKMMNVPLICSAILVRDKGQLAACCSPGNAEYLYHEYDHSDYDLGPLSLQCGRRADALKLWFAWKYFGDNGYEKRIDKVFRLAQHAQQIVTQHDSLELIAELQSVTVCFRYLPSVPNIKPEDVDTLNIQIRQALIETGKAMVNYSIIDNRVALRLAITNPDISTADLDQFFQDILQTGQRLTLS